VKEDHFLGTCVDGDVLSVAQQVASVVMFL